MEKPKIPFQSRLKAPTPVHPIAGTSRMVSQPRHHNGHHDDIALTRQPARQGLSRRSKSFSDLRKLEPSKKPPFAGATSKPLVAAKSTANLASEMKRPILKTAPLKSTKRTAATDEAPVKPKVAKVAKPAPYDYKARFNLLTEKHNSLLEAHKSTKLQVLEAEAMQERYALLQDEHVKLQEDFDVLKTDNLKNASLLQQSQTNNLRLEGELDTSKNEHIKLLEHHGLLQGSYAQLKSGFDLMCEEKVQVETELAHSCSRIKALEDDVQQLKMMLHSREEARRVMHNQIQDLKGTIRVFCRVRPSKNEEDHRLLCNITYIDEETLEIKKSKESVSCISGKSADTKQEFSFDKVFPPEATQAEVFEELSQLVQSALDGYHVCVFAYGQTGSGKTYTMQGEDNNTYAGMIPRTITLIFDNIANLQRLGWTYEVEVSFLEIYNETLRDLLERDKNKHLEIRFNEGKGTIVTNLTVKSVQSVAELHYLMAVANKNRAVAVTNYNEHSSRSHSVAKITLNGRNEDMKIKYGGSLSLVDLAGSESAKTSSSERIVETKNINKSLSTLGTVMTALHNRESHIPFRNSKLTYLLQSSLDGNSKTLMFVNVAPFEECYGESLNALRFAAKVKEVKVHSKRNKAYLRREQCN